MSEADDRLPKTAAEARAIGSLHYFTGKPRDQRDSQLKTHYGISLTDYQRMLADQNGACAICKTPATKTLAVDHSRVTGAVRALLCNVCNIGLGMFREKPEWLRQAATYLETCPGSK